MPYIGQGAQMAMEDCGVLAQLLRHHCCGGGTAPFAPTADNLARATDAYQAMRIPRTHRILGASHTLGKTQQRRAESWWYNLARELEIKLQVALHGTLPIMKPGAAYDYAEDVKRFIAQDGAEPSADAEPKGETTYSTYGLKLTPRASVAAAAAVAVAAAATALLVVARRR